MAKVIFSIICLILSGYVEANSIFKCIKDDKIVFSQHSCPKEFRQHKIEYVLGITTETDSDKRLSTLDPLQVLLQKETISKERLLQLLESEMYRLKQENSYFEILRASELQKLERNRYWQKKESTDPEYAESIQKMNLHFDNLITNNTTTIILLDDRKEQITQETTESQ
ncbi:hypothetical protein CXF83_04825 [Shewanella sp. Choline-02u-19]|jgi:hypothetical protein|uniref:hypothetical protein n=1 Tax=unclassified Shewanella TaxID=196818 RepID=UPI000C32A621|nr:MULTISPECIES: hypothetical protein [unclassified Shewanella]PKG56396.1 hypothetical protein CXF82_15050 [Shewanella sp. GutDb-MelDb]PKG73099.1 hypothetical protein CXF86_19460 [Shewanella sp. GutCb]PKH55558.1 hypothetical protein CXF84_17250 [Shewanella sp. Bg11-22]PKI29968.1 hypothetical protein CXF83_04825 [Shewanella sp. Choline-02u-19]